MSFPLSRTEHTLRERLAARCAVGYHVSVLPLRLYLIHADSGNVLSLSWERSEAAALEARVERWMAAGHPERREVLE